MRLRAEGTGATRLLTTGKWPSLCSAPRTEEGSGPWALSQVESQNAEAGGLTAHPAGPLPRCPWAVWGGQQAIPGQMELCGQDPPLPGWEPPSV